MVWSTCFNQDGLYALFLKGLTKGQENPEKKLITNLVTWIVIAKLWIFELSQENFNL
jgi:hypothetical protein